MNKMNRVLYHLLGHGFISDSIAENVHDIKGLSQIISKLRALGFHIERASDAFGKPGYSLDPDADMTPSFPVGQKDIILTHLLAFGSISPGEALHKYGVHNLSSVIDRLRKDNGVNIITCRSVQGLNETCIYVRRPE